MARSPLDTSLPSETINNDSLFKRQSTLPEVAKASFKQGMDFAETSSIGRMVGLKISENEDDITDHHELNKRFPQIEVPFNKPTSLEMAHQMAKNADIRRERANIISNGDPDSVAHSVISFGANMIPQALDPVGIAAGIFIGGGISKATGMFKSMKSAAQVSFKAKMAKRMTEGVIGNVASEVLIVNPATRQEQADVDTFQSVSNAVIGGLAFPLILGSIGKGIEMIKGGPKGADILTKTGTLSESQMQMGKKVDVTDYLNAERIALLDKHKAELESMQKSGLGKGASAERVAKKIEDLETEIKATEEIPVQDREKIAEKANSPEEDLYHDPKAVDAIAEGQRNLDTEDVTQAFKKRMEESETLIQTLKKEGVLDEADVKELEAIKADLDSVDKIDEMMKAATVCLRGK